MIRKTSAIVACIVVFVFTAATASVLTLAGYNLYLVNAGRLQSAQEAPPPSAAPSSGADYSRLDEIRGVYHELALKDVPDQTLVDGAAKGMAWGSGDVYSEYFTADEFQQFQQEETGEYVGIGIQILKDPVDGLLTVVVVYKDSPAEKAGMQIGDKLIRIDDVDITMKTQEEIVKLVRGAPDTSLKISVLRGQDVKDLTMVRAKIAISYVRGEMKNNGMAYIQIYEFGGIKGQPNNAAIAFKDTVKSLRAQGMKGFVLDLRNNPGGSLDIVSAIADELLPGGNIVTIKDRDGNTVNKNDSGAGHLGLPMVVLINENSASASELLSGDIQDYKVGKLIGVTTYGKGVAQTFQQFDDNSCLKYTYGQYLTGGGRCPQGVGIKPDIEVVLTDAVRKNPLLLCTPDDNQYMRALNELAKLIR